MPTKTKTSKRELIEPNKGGDKARFFRTESNSTCSILTRENARQSLATSHPNICPT